MQDINKDANHTIYDVEMRKLDNRENNKKFLLAFYRLNKGKIISTILSLITLICLFNFGFFKTLGIWVVMVIGYFVGAYFDKDVRVLQIIRKIIN